MRRFLIGLISFVAVFVGFWVYVAVMDTPPIQVPHVDDTPDMEVPQTEVDTPLVGGTKFVDVGQTRYFKYDPITKEIVAEYGFQVLLNPGEGSSRWRVKKPYLIFYQKGYQYRVDSKRGTIQMETVGSQNVAPTDAQLDEDVVIHIMPRTGSQMAETTILMDDLTFSSERSEFATDGPVTIQSKQVQMDGYGLILIFNTGVGKIEYLQIKDMEFLRLRGFAASGIGVAGESAKGTDESGDETETTLAKPLTEDPVTADESTQQAAASQPEVLSQEKEEAGVDVSDLYQCAIHDNVSIQYGDELIVSGADQVNIQNIQNNLFSGTNEEESGDIPDEQVATEETKTVMHVSSPESGPVSEPSEAVAQEMQPTPQVEDDSQDIVVRCDGGMIIRPMKDTGVNSTDSGLALEMSGDPLKIDRFGDQASDGSQMMAHCGALSYKPAEDILRLFTNTLQPQILLNTQQSNSRIETSGNVFWDRKAQRANFAGPGKVYLGDAKNPTAQPSEISFKGVMDLLFAQMSDNVSSSTIQTINLTGGMDALLRQNGTLKTLADSAVLEFGNENQLSQAHLSGDVFFESLEAGKPSSRAAAESAVFYFENNQIANADFSGAVHFASVSGQMDSANAKIEFQPDENGAMHPKMIRTDGQAILETVASATNQPPAKFEAKRIDYDLQTGAGLAHGPVRFTFYQPNDSDAAESVDAWIPVVITADENAQFLANANTSRDIRQIVFNENVMAIRLFETPLFTQQDEFHGDKLVVDVCKNDLGKTDISKITFIEGKVFGQSKKLRDEEILFNVRLTGQEMSYDLSNDIILAKGPGKIELDNSKAQSTESGGTGINFRRPCVARIKDFDTIKFDLNEQELVADGQEKTMLIEYWPLENGIVVDEILVSSMQFKSNFTKDSMSRAVLSRVFTDQGIYFEQKGKHILVGQTLEYDALNDIGWLTITGTEANPCFINGNRAPVIHYNVNTGQFDTTLSQTPGVFRTPK